MSRRKSTIAEAPDSASGITQNQSPVATAKAPPLSQTDTGPGEPTFSTDDTPKNWGPPYKAIFTSGEKGFEMGENRRYKQRVFTFKDKPDDATIGKLKDAGFTYRPAEKSWTIQADTASRLTSDRLAHEFAGIEFSMSR